MLQTQQNSAHPMRREQMPLYRNFNLVLMVTADCKLSGMEAFSKEFKVHRKLLDGADGIPIEDFITTDVLSWF